MVMQDLLLHVQVVCMQCTENLYDQIYQNLTELQKQAVFTLSPKKTISTFYIKVYHKQGYKLQYIEQLCICTCPIHVKFMNLRHSIYGSFYVYLAIYIIHVQSQTCKLFIDYSFLYREAMLLSLLVSRSYICDSIFNNLLFIHLSIILILLIIDIFAVELICSITSRLYVCCSSSCPSDVQPPNYKTNPLSYPSRSLVN